MLDETKVVHSSPYHDFYTKRLTVIEIRASMSNTSNILRESKYLFMPLYRRLFS